MPPLEGVDGEVGTLAGLYAICAVKGEPAERVRSVHSREKPDSPLTGFRGSVGLTGVDSCMSVIGCGVCGVGVLSCRRHREGWARATAGYPFGGMTPDKAEREAEAVRPCEGYGFLGRALARRVAMRP